MVSAGWAADEKAKVSSGDTTEGFLMDKFQAGPDIELTESGTTNRVIIIGRKPVLTSKGDVLTHDGTKETRLGSGANGEVLTSDSTAPNGIKWDTVPAGPAGPAGPPGPQGPQGPQGNAGVAGPQGDTGPEGPEGPEGPAGISGKDDVDGVEITFTREFQYDPGTGSEPAIDLNGTDLVINQINPTVTLGGQTRNVLAFSDIPNTNPPLQQVIVDLPESLIAGNYKLKLSNTQGDSEGFIPLSELSITFHDLTKWEQITTSTPIWTARNGFSQVVFDNKMWILQGYTGVRSDEIWNSLDGITWNQVTGTLPPLRDNHAAVVLNGKIYVMGGSTGGSNYKDVWSSSDGITWTEETSNAPWGPLEHLKTVAYDGKIWVLGGAGASNDVWYSSDGANWTQATSSAPWSAPNGHSVLVFDNKMWVVSSTTNGVWYSTDGSNWTQSTANVGFQGGTRNYSGAVVYDNKMWLISGRSYPSGSPYYADVYSSTDGITWSLVTSSPPWAGRIANVLSFKNRVWMLGGFDGVAINNEVWATKE